MESIEVSFQSLIQEAEIAYEYGSGAKNDLFVLSTLFNILAATLYELDYLYGKRNGRDKKRDEKKQREDCYSESYRFKEEERRGQHAIHIFNEYLRHRLVLKDGRKESYYGVSAEIEGDVNHNHGEHRKEKASRHLHLEAGKGRHNDGARYYEQQTIHNVLHKHHVFLLPYGSSLSPYRRQALPLLRGLARLVSTTFLYTILTRLPAFVKAFCNKNEKQSQKRVTVFTKQTLFAHIFLLPPCKTKKTVL